MHQTEHNECIKQNTINDFISRDPLKEQPMVQIKKDEILIKSLRNTTAWFRPTLNGSEL